jgi:hypothetical protein
LTSTSHATTRAGSVRTGGLLAIAALCLTISTAQARSAKCFTTDDGDFACDFQSTAKDGSFRISARGKPTYLLNVDAPDTAYGFVNVGNRNTPLPGRYLRSKTEPGCWVNDTTSTKICAR